MMSNDKILDRAKINAGELLTPDTKAMELYEYLKDSPKVQSFLRAANRMAVSRLGYTDHGLVHAEVATWNALKAFSILDKTFKPNIVAEGIGDTDDAQLAIVGSTYLHDIGMTIHRSEHFQAAVMLSMPILEEKLNEMYSDPGKATDILSTILHGIYAHDDETQCLTLEAGITKIGDGCDMTKGRTYLPSLRGKVDIHSVSAMAIENVSLSRGQSKALDITVAMDNPAGVFQVEAVLGKKILTTGLKDHIKVKVRVNGEKLVLSEVQRLYRDMSGDEAVLSETLMSNKE